MEASKFTIDGISYTVKDASARKRVDTLESWMIKRNTEYNVGDVVMDSKLPSYLRLVCIEAGTTSSEDNDYSGLDLSDISTPE